MEILEILEKVKNISNLFNTSEDNHKTNDEDKEDITNNDDDKFLNLINTIQLFKNLNDNNYISEKKDLNNINNENIENKFNFEFNNPNINSIIRILPYLDFDYQKEVSVFLKFMEIKHLMNSYKNVISTASITEKDNAKKNVLLTIKSKLHSEKQPIIDVFLKFLEINEIVNKMKHKESYNEL